MTTPAADAATRDVLARFHFDRIPFDDLREQYVAARDDPESLHRITEQIGVPGAASAGTPPQPGTPSYEELASEGRDAIARGELAVVVLAGGMATRFGAAVKGLAPVLRQSPSRCFLDYKLADAARFAGAIDVAILTSFATDSAITAHLGGRSGVSRAPQFVSIRLTEEGDKFIGADGQASLHAPGHGDLPDALAVAGVLDRWRTNGVKTVLMTNVDNLGATIDPVLLAWHRRQGRVISVELVQKIGRDKGGMPVVHADGSLVLAEAFRFPSGFAQDDYPLFNTNTLWIDLPALAPPHPWTWSVARKTVDGRQAIQFERLVGELTWWHLTNYVHVSRDRANSRFIPVKDIEDLDAAQQQIAAVVTSRLGLAL